ncbi:hypothetical protein BDM02DRAFT_1382067 [Thelephora ganbajun]|uniref:Uncharacterized protein n=1 Tax=Thelephora ganbajun TaxID=370292 RepID=A0ACB6ZMX7_THEGA|nr:hypothetical protein BDM02DRAFT_1382067 [Thelephora ganbajun]
MPLCLEDRKKENPTGDEKNFVYYWRKLSPDERQVCCILPSSHLILSDTRTMLFRRTRTVLKNLYAIVAFVTCHDVYLMSRLYRLQDRTQAVVSVVSSTVL